MFVVNSFALSVNLALPTDVVEAVVGATAGAGAADKVVDGAADAMTKVDESVKMVSALGLIVEIIYSFSQVHRAEFTNVSSAAAQLCSLTLTGTSTALSHNHRYLLSLTNQPASTIPSMCCNI